MYIYRSKRHYLIQNYIIIEVSKGTEGFKMADAVNLQYQVRQNNEELQDFLKDLYKWEDEVQAKDKLLVNSKASVDSVRLKPSVNSRVNLF